MWENRTQTVFFLHAFSGCATRTYFYRMDPLNEQKPQPIFCAEAFYFPVCKSPNVGGLARSKCLSVTYMQPHLQAAFASLWGPPRNLQKLDFTWEIYREPLNKGQIHKMILHRNDALFPSPDLCENNGLHFDHCDSRLVLLNNPTSECSPTRYRFVNGDKKAREKHINEPIKGRCCKACLTADHNTHLSVSWREGEFL